MEIPLPTRTSRARSGLSMLLGPVQPQETTQPMEGDAALLHLPLAQVYRNEAQPRTHFDAEAIHALATSIEASGVIQPIAVRARAAGGFEIIAGERRWLAAQQAGLATIPAVLHDCDEQETLVLGLVENLVREDLSPLETARAYCALHDEFQMSIADIARSVGRSRPAVSNTMRLLELPDDVLDLMERAQLTEGHGRALLGLQDRAKMVQLAHLTVKQGLTVRSLEERVREQASSPQRSTKRAWNIEPDAELLERMRHVSGTLLGVRGKLKLGSRGAKLELHAGSAQEMVALLERLERALDNV